MKLTKNLNQRAAFTLIELLAVITIIGILAGLVIGVAGLAGTKKKIALVESQKQHLIAVIEAYHDKMGCYPPDGIKDNDRANANINPLLYELTGTTNNPIGNNKREFYPLNINNIPLTTDEIKSKFGKGGFINSKKSPEEPQNFYRLALKTQQYEPYDTVKTNVCGLLVPVDLEAGKPNFWYYDSSSTNRHNSDSFDLWAEIRVGKGTNTICNW